MTSSFPGSEPAPGLVVSTHLRTAAGSPLPVEVTLTNTSSSPRVLTVGALGVDAAWLPTPTRTAVLEPGQSTIVTLVLSPTRGTVPGHYPFAFTVQALDPATGRPAGATVAMIDSTLVVNPRNQLTLELKPRSVSTVSSRKVMLALRNGGNEPARVTLDVQTSPRVRVRFRKKVVEVLPGATEQVRGRATVTHRRLFGGVDHHSYTVSASGTESLRHVEGSVTQRPLVGTMLMKAVALLAVLAVWIGAAVIFIPQLANRLGDRSSETTTTATADGGGKDSADGGGGQDGGDGGDSGGGSGGSDDQGSEDKGAGGQGGTKQVLETKDDEIALTGTVAGEAPGGVRVSLEPTSLVDEDAQGGVGVGVPGSQLGTTGMSLASSFLNRALPTTPPDRTSTTTADGSWAFAGVKKPGYYLVTFTKKGFQKQSFVIDSTSEASAEPLEVNLVAGGGSLSGTVTGPRGKVGAATVTITDGTNTITTSSNSKGRIGHWSVKGLSTPGAYVVQASKPGLSSESRMVSLTAGGTGTADLTLKSGVASLTGKVRAVDESGKLAGVGGATVTVTGEDGSVRSATTLTQGDQPAGSRARATADFVGTYTVPGLPVPATYVVTLSGPGMQTQTSKVTLKRGQSEAGVDADLVSSSGSVAGTITGLSTAGDKSGIVGAGLTLSNADNTYKTMSTSEPVGSFLFDGVAPGTYALRTQFFGFVTDHVTVTVRAGRTVTANRQVSQIEGGVLAARSGVQGRAIDGSTSLPVTCPTAEPACLVAKVVETGVDDGTDDDRTYTTTFLPTDQFTLPDRTADPAGGLLPGLHTVVVSAPHYSTAVANVRIANNETANIGTVALLPAPKIVGTITAAAGSPAGNTCVFAVPNGGAVPDAGCDTSATGGAKACKAATATFGADETATVCAYVDGTGSYNLEVPSQGTYTLYVQPADTEYLDPSPSSILLESGVTRNQSYVLNRLGRVVVTARTPGSTGALVPSVGTVVGPVPGEGTAVPATAATDGTGTMRFVAVKPGTYTIGANDSGLSASKTFTVGLNQEASVRLNLTSPITTVVGQLTSSLDGLPTKVQGAKVKVTAPVGYGDDDSVNLGSVEMTTNAQGCFAIEQTGSASPALAVGDCTWAGPTTPPGPADLSRGKQTFLSPAASSVQLTAPGYATETKTNLTLGVGAPPNAFTMTPVPVQLGTVRPAVDPADAGFNWSQVSFTAVPKAGPTNAISVSATGTGTGALAWLDSRVGTPNMVLPGKYTITATRAGYLDATRTLDCPLAVNSLVRCSWDATAPGEPAGNLTLTKLSSLEVKAVVSGGVAVPGARYVLSRGGTTLQTVTDTAGTGAVTFTDLDPRVDDDYVVAIRVAGYGFGDTTTLPLSCTPAPTGSLTLELRPGITTSCEATLTKLGVITGTLSGVRAAPPGTPTDPVDLLTGAAVRVQECTTSACEATTGPVFTGTTDGNGDFSVTGTADTAGLDTSKTWLVTATVPGYSMVDPPGAALPGTVVTGFTAGEADADLTMYIDPVDVSVVLLDGTGTPYEETANVQLLRLTTTGTVPIQTATKTGTGANTAYTLSDIIPGSYVVSVGGGGLQSTTQTATIGSNGQVVSVSVVRAANVAYGTITADDIASPSALALAHITICKTLACTATAKGTDNADMETDTDGAGNFQIRTVPDGTFYVKVVRNRYETQVLGPYTFNHVLGAVLPITTEMLSVKRGVKITVDPTWDNDDLSASVVTLTRGSTTLTSSGALTSDGDGGWVASFTQVHWGCWQVAVALPTGHHGTRSAPQDAAPADSTQTTCTSTDLVVSGDRDEDGSTTATIDVDEGRLDIKTKATKDSRFSTTVPTATVVSVKRGATSYLTDQALTTGSVATIWLPTGVEYDLTADLATDDSFWDDAADEVTLDDEGDGDDPTVVELVLHELHADLVVNVTGLAGTQASLTLTSLSGVTVPTGIPTITVAGTATFEVPKGDWKVVATVGTPAPPRSANDHKNVTSPTGSYTISLAIPPVVATGATAGAPGTFTPTGAVAPANLAALSGITASPTTAWTTGQHVVLGDSSKAYWNGTAWVAGQAPA